MTKQKLRPVIVTTQRGVYFGWASDTSRERIKLERARHCYYWALHPDPAHRGVYGLATAGPAEGSKVGPPVTLTIRNVYNVVEVDKAALPAWEAATWQ